MRSEELLEAIGTVDESCLQRCEAYCHGLKRRQKFARRAALFAATLLGGLLAAYLTIPQVAALFGGGKEQEVYDYIQLPPELTSWVEENENGGVTTSAGILRGDVLYLLTQEEYHRLMDENADPDQVLAERETWAAQWRDYTPPEDSLPDGVDIVE